MTTRQELIANIASNILISQGIKFGGDINSWNNWAVRKAIAIVDETLKNTQE